MRKDDEKSIEYITSSKYYIYILCNIIITMNTNIGWGVAIFRNFFEIKMPPVATTNIVFNDESTNVA